MASDGDLKDHALNSSHDFYRLLGIAVSANSAEIRTAYRKTALKYHPDKVASNQEALDKFHLLQVAYDVLSDENVRALYDNARRAREEKKLRESAYSDKRRQMKDELEARERAGVAGLKRKREDAREEEAFQQELKRLAADGARRRKEREEMLRKEMADAMEEERKERTPEPQPTAPTKVEETDRTIKLRYPAGTTDLGQSQLTSLFERFGKIEHVLLRDKKIKPEGEKHRKDYTIAIIVYESIVAAHKAVTDFPHLMKQEPAIWGRFEDVNWQSGKEPDCIPKPKRKEESASSTPHSTPKTKGYATGDAPSTPAARFKTEHGLKKVPSFGSFKGTPKAATGTPTSGLDAEDAMMIRLKQAAERKRLAEEIKRQEAEEEAALEQKS
ncbi:Pre-mRNA-splicing factor cwf23 [Fulvia fulva]|uniref:Pre-mRNA-splicing factor cwf23 n=1 Tax=Passalora fulva TaxID=5499 RepID=A0A9Q8LBH1_PASFU|nr:Pre-mRNA-splicing factor cwf23 [Fulvia fulva]KAK4631925.1 Pre-mRNA-splicing factor cwf23 [Fulvia fulva]KAK4633555.1 Pre-mRNA-splicing factor cwf23 [Fulvia fulva]UJO14358.1 Pre-mRNA-splicing factor cwf23 [Fulvia fulva]WPV11098.1 Pre-mRNA-splicing factor cwf23 [Fulvia fulva]WPV26747.1 Pre-mRNA-splicing factor cwf23 [Fulvia fulva]